jgi:hypothetical protein
LFDELCSKLKGKILRLIFLLFLYNYACAAPVQKPEPPTEAERLREKRDLYCELSKPLFKERGHVVSKCDGALFAALHAVGCGFPDVNRWQADTGQIFRSLERDCFIPPATKNGANAEASKDMLQGWLLRQIQLDDPKPVRSFLRFAHDGGGYFCKAIDLQTRISKCLLPPTTAFLMRVFSGVAKPFKVENDASFTTPEYTKHLKIIRKLQIAMVYGRVSKTDLRQVRSIAEAQPNNALYQATLAVLSNGDITPAYDLLLNESHWPADALPTSANHCSDYLYQRAEDPGDWEPCPERNETYFGTDFIFAATVALRGLF